MASRRVPVPSRTSPTLRRSVPAASVRATRRWPSPRYSGRRWDGTPTFSATPRADRGRSGKAPRSRTRTRAPRDGGERPAGEMLYTNFVIKLEAAMAKGESVNEPWVRWMVPLHLQYHRYASLQARRQKAARPRLRDGRCSRLACACGASRTRWTSSSPCSAADSTTLGSRTTCASCGKRRWRVFPTRTRRGDRRESSRHRRRRRWTRRVTARRVSSAVFEPRGCGREKRCARGGDRAMGSRQAGGADGGGGGRGVVGSRPAHAQTRPISD